MHNLKTIRENPDLFKKKILERNVKINFEELVKLDKKKQRNNTKERKIRTGKENNIKKKRQNPI